MSLGRQIRSLRIAERAARTAVARLAALAELQVSLAAAMDKACQDSVAAGGPGSLPAARPPWILSPTSEARAYSSRTQDAPYSMPPLPRAMATVEPPRTSRSRGKRSRAVRECTDSCLDTTLRSVAPDSAFAPCASTLDGAYRPCTRLRRSPNIAAHCTSIACTCSSDDEMTVSTMKPFSS